MDYPNFILLSGIGHGKTYLGDLLVEDCKAKSVPCERRMCGNDIVGLLRSLEQKPPEKRVIIETNCSVDPKDVPRSCQHIEIFGHVNR